MDPLVARVAVAFPVVGQQHVDLAGGGGGRIGHRGHAALSWRRTIGPFWEPVAMEDCKDLDILSVTTTVGSRADAQALARAIMQQRLAACVQVEEGITSFYRWQGRDCEDAEVRLTIKTLPACAGPLRALFKEKHPYEVPQFLAVTMVASRDYFDWAVQLVAAPRVLGSPYPR